MIIMKNHLFYQLSVLPLLILMFCSCQQEEKEPVVVQEYVCSQEPNSYLHQLSYDLEYSNEEEDGLIYKNVSELVKDTVDVFELTFWTVYVF